MSVSVFSADLRSIDIDDIWRFVMSDLDQFPRKVLRLPQVRNATGLSRATIYRKMKDRSFPIAVRLGDRAVGWYADEIDKFNSECLRILAPRATSDAKPIRHAGS